MLYSYWRLIITIQETNNLKKILWGTIPNVSDVRLQPDTKEVSAVFVCTMKVNGVQKLDRIHPLTLTEWTITAKCVSLKEIKRLNSK